MSGSESKRQRKDALAAAADTTGSVLIGGGANETDETTAEPASVLQPPMMTGAQVGAQPAGGPPYANSLVAASIVPAQPMAQQQAQPQGVPGSTCGPGRGHAPRPRRGKYRVVDGKKHMEFMASIADLSNGSATSGTEEDEEEGGGEGEEEGAEEDEGEGGEAPNDELLPHSGHSGSA